MKRTFFYAVWGAAISLGVLNASDSLESIADIRVAYAKVNKLASSITPEVVPVNDQSSEGGEAKIYKTKEGAVHLIRELLMGETGKWQREIYYANKEPFFIFEVTSRYNVPMYLPQFDVKKTERTEDRYYFLHGKMVRWLHGKESIKSVDPTFAKKERILLEEAREWLKRVK